MTWNNQFIQNLLLGPEIITRFCVLFSSDKFLTSINSCKALYQPNSFAHSLTNLLYWAYWAHPLLLSGFGLRFVTLHLCSPLPLSFNSSYTFTPLYILSHYIILNKTYHLLYTSLLFYTSIPIIFWVDVIHQSTFIILLNFFNNLIIFKTINSLLVLTFPVCIGQYLKKNNRTSLFFSV